MAAGPNGRYGALVPSSVEEVLEFGCDHVTHQRPSMAEPNAEEAITKLVRVTPTGVLVS